MWVHECESYEACDIQEDQYAVGYKPWQPHAVEKAASILARGKAGPDICIRPYLLIIFIHLLHLHIPSMQEQRIHGAGEGQPKPREDNPWEQLQQKAYSVEESNRIQLRVA